MQDDACLFHANFFSVNQPEGLDSLTSSAVYSKSISFRHAPARDSLLPPIHYYTRLPKPPLSLLTRSSSSINLEYQQISRSADQNPLVFIAREL